MKPAILAATLAIWLASACPRAVAQNGFGRIEEGQPFPRLTLPTLDGRMVSTADVFKNRKSLVVIFGSW